MTDFPAFGVLAFFHAWQTCSVQLFEQPFYCWPFRGLALESPAGNRLAQTIVRRRHRHFFQLRLVADDIELALWIEPEPKLAGCTLGMDHA